MSWHIRGNNYKEERKTIRCIVSRYTKRERYRGGYAGEVWTARRRGLRGQEKRAERQRRVNMESGVKVVGGGEKK